MPLRTVRTLIAPNMCRRSMAYPGQIIRAGTSLSLVVITTEHLPDAQVGIAYSKQLHANGGVPPYTYTVVHGSLPAGLSINTQSRSIAGTPTEAGIFNILIQAVDSGSNIATKHYTLTVIN